MAFASPQLNAIRPQHAEAISAEEQRKRDIILGSFARRAYNYLDHASKYERKRNARPSVSFSCASTPRLPFPSASL